MYEHKYFDIHTPYCNISIILTLLQNLQKTSLNKLILLFQNKDQISYIYLQALNACKIAKYSRASVIRHNDDITTYV